MPHTYAYPTVVPAPPRHQQEPTPMPAPEPVAQEAAPRRRSQRELVQASLLRVPGAAPQRTLPIA